MKRRAKLRLPAAWRRRSNAQSRLGRWLRQCWCARCTLDRVGLYRHRRSTDGQGIRVEHQLLGLPIHRQVVVPGTGRDEPRKEAGTRWHGQRPQST